MHIAYILTHNDLIQSVFKHYHLGILLVEKHNIDVIELKHLI